LLHGFGFAGALVEIGQLAFVSAVLALAALAARFSLRWPRWGPSVPPYAIGIVAMFWVAERVAAF
jgi:hypothetical protein